MLRNLLLGTTFLRNPPDQPGVAPVIEPVAPVVEAAPAASPEPPVSVQEPAAAVSTPSPSPPAQEPAAADPTPEAKPAEPAAADAKLDAHATETLLEQALKPKEEPAAAKPAEPAKEGEKPAAEAAKPVEPAAVVAPVYEIKLPENFQANNEALDGYKAVLAENKIAPEVGQKLADMYVAEMNRYAEHQAAEQHRVWSDMRAQWVKDVKSDAQIGGAGFETSMSQIAEMRDLLVAPEDVKGFDEFLRTTGAGDNKFFLKMLHNAHRYLGEPSAPAIAGAPTKTNGQSPNRGRGLRAIYENDRAARSGN